MVYMFVTSSKSRKNIVHTDTCCYASRIKEEHRVEFNSITEAIHAGKCYCERCSVLYQEYRKNKKWIDDFISDKDMILKFDEHGINVISPYGKWYIVQAKINKLSLYHYNTKGCDKVSLIRYYHNQKVDTYNIKKLFEYIYSHDMYRKDNPDDFLKPKTLRKAKTPPQKGTHRYEKQQRYEKKLEKKNQQKRLMFLFEMIETRA